MSKISILDASAVLAYLQEEKGSERVDEALDASPCWMTAVNLSEVLGKLCDKGMPLEEAQTAVRDLRLTVVNFDTDLAALAAGLRAKTRSIGASLGDRACLALAQQARNEKLAPSVLTCERAWAKPKWPFRIVLAR